MAVEVKNFSGKLNLDNSPLRLPPNDHVQALNITRNNSEIVHNLAGNVLVNNPYLSNEGVNKRIGHKEDVTRNRVYEFIWNSENFDVISYYDAALDQHVKVVQNLLDTDNIDVLHFDPSYRINHIDIIYRDDDGDLLMWCTGNATPKCGNVTRLVNVEFPILKEAFIEMAKKPTLSPPLCIYGTDLTRNANTLRRSIFQFSTRPEFLDFQKATWSTYSKVPLPIGYYGSDNDIANTSNNFITITVETGDIDVAKIEISMRYSLGNVWSDFVLVASLDKEQLSIPSNSTYQFLFYNDGIYPPLDINETLLLFDWVPPLAGTQALPNGNIPVYGDITEGFENYPVNDLRVTITAENIKNIPPDADPPSISYVEIGTNGKFIFTVKGSVPTGTYYKIFVNLPTNPGPINGEGILAQYTSLPGDTITDVATALWGDAGFYHDLLTPPDEFSVDVPAGSVILYIDIVPGGSGGANISTEKTWMWNCNYIFGLVYVDEQNRDIPGVTTFSNPTSTANDFSVTTPAFSLDTVDPETPVITATINHIPPPDAVAFYWVRRRLTYDDFLMYETCDFQEDADFYYLCLANVAGYKANNSQFIYGDVPINSESRIQVIAGIASSAYDGNLWLQDYPILGTVIRLMNGGTSPQDDRSFIKIKIPTSVPSPVYQANMLVMVYTPFRNPITEGTSVYWEWGEKFNIYTDGGIRYHRGGTQDQIGSQPAIYVWPEGDVYFHQRQMYNDRTFDSTISDTVSLMDANFSDFFESAVNDNGRAQVIEVNAREQRNPVLVRFGQAFEAGTNINNINRFYFLNYDEYSRDFGTIMKMFIERRRLYIFQQYETGVVPVLTQIVKDTANNPLQANSDLLLNKITYPYAGKHGIGDVPESFAYSNGAKYFIDSNLGIPIRLSGDGAIELSILYQTNNFFINQLAAYGKGLDNGIVPAGEVYKGNPTVYGAFDNEGNKYIISFEGINRYSDPSTLVFHQDAATISFFETRTPMEGFESNLSYQSEGVGCLNNLVISWVNGQLWRHNSPVFNNFYGIQYPSSITPIYNSKVVIKKKQLTLGYLSLNNKVWACPEISTNTINPQTGLTQQSSLLERDFKLEETVLTAALLRDKNSMSDQRKSLMEGDYLGGNYISIKFEISATNAANSVSLVDPYLTDEVSQRNF